MPVGWLFQDQRAIILHKMRKNPYAGWLGHGCDWHRRWLVLAAEQLLAQLREQMPTATRSVGEPLPWGLQCFEQIDRSAHPMRD